MSRDHIDIFDDDDDSVLSRGSSRSHFEWPVKGRIFPQCETIVDWATHVRCLSTKRFIRFVQANNGKKLVCENGHNHLFEGKLFIPADEFGRHGAFPNVLPRELQPTDGEITASRWKIPKESKRRLDGEEYCAKCSAPPFPLYQTDDQTVLWEWITEYDSELLEKIHVDLRAKQGTDMRNWFGSISQALRTRIIRRINMSPLHIDHGISRKIADAHWHLLSRASRRFLQRNFLFPLCKKCNGSKSSKLWDRSDLTRMYIVTYYDDSVAAAKRDSARWALLEETLDVIYTQEKVG